MYISSAPTLRWITELEKIEEVRELLERWYSDPQHDDCPGDLSNALRLLMQLELEIKAYHVAWNLKVEEESSMYPD